ncbi:SPCS1-like protein [Mya arenaria]|uniref:Signal peptidase complex subunit 1 n=1 Tax=Mya arenaria TaxID=6604 RepID=A0ABY7F118_MYAAR|nr:signal peptidase complex subunit 1-like [Mya arenaria]XP_052760600.1 signal peptidase complex subunit 1-like [Mya arenaria]WAR14904.1 SPCS1-like protein [Mya arenaria]WAR14940.1 SPCS1-like protein [Mya arenaria]
MDIAKYLPECIKKIPTHMDFAGQQKAERMFQTIILSFATVGLVWGYICQQFSQTMYILITGFVISCLLTLPPWPMFRKTSLKWQKARPEPEEVGSTTAPVQKSKKKKN